MSSLGKRHAGKTRGNSANVHARAAPESCHIVHIETVNGCWR